MCRTFRVSLVSFHHLFGKHIKAENFQNMSEEIVEKKITPFKLGKSPQSRLDNLDEGRCFEIVGLERYYRNLYVARVTSGSVLIRGEKRDSEEDAWSKLIGHYISCSTIVRAL